MNQSWNIASIPLDRIAAFDYAANHPGMYAASRIC
jgi:hypothetical protein